MTEKEIESKIGRYLRKANRLKATRAKLDRVNELMALLREASSAPAGGNTVPAAVLANYLELGRLYKIKFQLDGLFADAASEMQRLKQHPELMTPKLCEHLRQRLQTILDIDAGYPEVQEMLKRLQTEYPQFAGSANDFETYFNLAQYQAPRLCIEIVCELQALEGQEHLKALSQQYQIAPPQSPSESQGVALRRMRFYGEDLKDFETLHEELHTKSSYQVKVNNHALDEQFFSDWFQCYRRFLKAQNPQYCYGASPFTFNFWGCHKLYVPDVAKQLEQCWFHSGELDPETGFFFVAAHPIVEQVRIHLEHCGFCPALTQEKLDLGMALLPRYINSEDDPRWRYDVTVRGRIGVLPAGKEIAITTLNTTGFSPESDKKGSPAEFLEFIEVGPTPCIHKILNYVQSKNPADLSETAYRGLSKCPNCGAPYKLHTMTCSKCRLDFWKYALKDFDNTLQRLRYAKALALPTGNANVREVRPDTSPTLVEAGETSLSFEQLWRDPEIQELLSGEQRPAEKDRGQQELPRKAEPVQAVAAERESWPKPSQLRAEAPAAAPILKTEPAPSVQTDFQEKLRGFVSRKYRERKALEKAFSQQTRPPVRPSELTDQEIRSSPNMPRQPGPDRQPEQSAKALPEKPAPPVAEVIADSPERAALINAVKSLKPRQKSELSKRGVVRVIYHATMDKDLCPLCRYLDGMVLDPNDPATDIFSPPLYPGCTCSREYVLKTEKPQHWPKVTFTFPPDELLIYLDK